MITCQKCRSINIKVSSLNFARVKLEGQPAFKHHYNKYSFYCSDCNNQWESVPEAEKDYHEYLDLCSKNTILSQDLKEDGGYGQTRQINYDELEKEKVLAKKIVSSYKHVLNINPSEWHNLEQSAGQ